MAINFPIPSYVGQAYTYNTKTWIWNGNGWVAHPNIGSTGPTGETGFTGATGETGATGFTGATGVGLLYSNLFEGKDVTFDVLSFSDTIGVSLFCDYYIINTTYDSCRAGTIIAVWNKNLNIITFTDNSTNDLNGSTSDLYFSMSIVNNDVILTSNITNDSWSLKISYKIL